MNYMKKVADMLGVALDEEFEIEGYGGSKFKITEEGLYNNNGHRDVSLFHGILTGEIKIKRRPWKPKIREKYWYVYRPTGVESEPWDLRYTTFNGCTDDLNHVAMGNCFSSKEAAEEAKNDVIARYEAILDTLKGKGE